MSNVNVNFFGGHANHFPIKISSHTSEESFEIVCRHEKNSIAKESSISIAKESSIPFLNISIGTPPSSSSPSSKENDNSPGKHLDPLLKNLTDSNIMEDVKLWTKPLTDSLSEATESMHSSWIKITSPNSLVKVAEPRRSMVELETYTTEASSPLSDYLLSPQGGAVGLKNLGNTCFLNAVVQCLAHVLPFVEDMLFNLEQPERAQEDEGGQGSASDNQELVASFKVLLGHVWSGSRRDFLEPGTLLKVLKSDKRSAVLFNHKQQDAHECLCILLDVLHQDTNGLLHGEEGGRHHPLRPSLEAQAEAAHEEWVDVTHEQASSPDKSPREEESLTQIHSVVSKHMGGRYTSEVRCMSCGFSTKITLEECMQLLETEETGLPWTCERCKARNASKRLHVASFPSVLVLHLERFGFRGGQDGSAAIFHLLAWTEHLGAEESSGHYVACAVHPDGVFRR
ncbi:hypothetical protein GUITHDRAFT_137129 [Guillardia theta CCMP2712]|uniref:ubiquitinyl hydrolase 1 n=1 Tax=Guillardia theta (strain CCMP2712) TaxID=905079 RepID=L1JHD0_GUITC|nr:hypothetical protein GUITHDRAFT_137129 [Guillardia theta CCMP2712]EKX47732.1 hypothetical protein GUITHDRAFT_137129 [Guillardia theta CCMP2712]|eukprot:XP_005834712.1 hypothetical protein GUITHDRAFT_137129 [Guillardia theta CCMP2712]